jgi:hypothetical protein
MTASAAAVKAGGPSNFAAANERASRASLFVFLLAKSVPPPPLRGAPAKAGTALTAAAPTVR